MLNFQIIKAVTAAISLAILLLFSTACSSKKTIWIYTSIYEDVISEMKEPLNKILPKDVEVKWYQAGSENIAARLNAEISAGGARADLILTSDPFYYHELKAAGLLLAYKSEAAAKIPADYKDPDGYYAGNRLPVMVIGYNSNIYKENSGIPSSWSDLIKPVYQNKLSMPNPLESGSTFTSVILLSRKMGWDYFSALRKQNITAAGGNSSVITRIETGEKPVGIVLFENIVSARRRGSPVRAVFPSEGALPVMSPIAIMKSTKNPETAKLVYDWFFSADAQRPKIKSGMYSQLKDYSAPEYGIPSEELARRLLPWSPALLAEAYGERAAVKDKFSKIILY